MLHIFQTRAICDGFDENIHCYLPRYIVNTAFTIDPLTPHEKDIKGTFRYVCKRCSYVTDI
jgi:hypothetical protein